jgi:hypothetical protein
MMLAVRRAMADIHKGGRIQIYIHECFHSEHSQRLTYYGLPYCRLTGFSLWPSLD